MHEFASDFYGHEMKAIVLGYIRAELDYVSRGEYTPRHPQPHTESDIRMQRLSSKILRRTSASR